MNLYQLTHTATIAGYVRLPFWIQDVRGSWACLELEAYNPRDQHNPPEKMDQRTTLVVGICEDEEGIL